MGAGLMGIVAMAFALSRMIVNRVARADTEKQVLSNKVLEASKLASVGELAAGIAHEINNPVAIMVEEAGLIDDLLEETAINDDWNLSEYKRATAQILNQGLRCKEITHKLLSFARRTDTTVEDVDIGDLLEELIALSARRAKYDMIEILTDIRTGLPPIRVSPSELQQVIFNLINNAMDAMEKTGGTLTVSARRQSRQIVIAVSDTGHGIPEANLERIFDPFFTSKAVGKGTGLGLSVCYGIVEKIGGRIEVQSTIGTGTTFSVFIPVTQEHGALRHADATCTRRDDDQGLDP